MQRSVELEEAQIHELERLASKDQRTVDELVHIAVGDYLARRHDRSDWAKRLEAAVDQIRIAMPADATSEEIEADVTAAVDEHRAARTAPRMSDGAPDAGGH